MMDDWIYTDGLIESLPNTSIDLMFDDGTVLVECLKQFDGDIWCKVLGTEFFFDPKYISATITHYRFNPFS